MDVRDLPGRARELESAILNLIVVFEQETGVGVARVELHNSRLSTREAPITVSVMVEVTL